ncbi:MULTISPECIES: RNA-binding S4 domain-containing protein [Vitreoscilla]|uniref:RNA-binding S4 domain-containing protein n=1 Tax=Vitreoscilla stercoraria TaxID=61 RepID=A0ABY4EAY7_VITST|nr:MULTISPECIES: RNA-binding S4 domain-containing protein [Vitreoscilla]AUZ06237.2 RNA-binding protein [Vitreoscilla sp. C1]UOO92404.1 RNA-binding S4 domain-containing protein [Vitreoscilla stercoraria]
MNETFDLLEQQHIALCDLLKITGAAESGGQAKALISDGLVLRNGQVEIRKTAKIKDGETITMPEFNVTIVVTKSAMA